MQWTHAPLAPYVCVHNCVSSGWRRVWNHLSHFLLAHCAFFFLPHREFVFLKLPPSLPLATAARPFGTNAFRAFVAGCEYMWRCICISLFFCLCFSHLLRSTEKSFTLRLSQKTLPSPWKLAGRQSQSCTTVWGKLSSSTLRSVTVCVCVGVKESEERGS